MEKQLNILIIEDEPADLAIISSHLMETKQAVPSLVTATTLKEAMTFMRTSQLDAVVCDLNLPDSHGLETAKLVVAEGVPVVVLTCSGEHELAEKAIRLGAQDYLEKDNLTSCRLWRSLLFAIERHALSSEWEEIRRDREQKRRLEAIGRFSGGVAHDINNALAVVIGYTDILLEDGADALDENAPLIRQGADRIAQHVKRLTQVGGHQESVTFGVMDLPGAVRSLRLHTEKELPPGIHLEFKLQDNCFVSFCDYHLHLILEHLIANASEAMEGTGVIHVGCQREEEEVCLWVQDEGSGIAPALLDTVRDPYFSTKGRGHPGLGLSVVAGLMQATEGRIDIASSSDGTCVACHFPVASKPLVTGASAPFCPFGKPARESKPKVLLAEDEQTLRLLVGFQLDRMGYDVCSAADGVDAVETFIEAPGSFDLLISDVLMPRMTGPELVDRVRQVRPELPVLIMTGHSNGQLRQESWYHPEIPVLLKPFGMHELREKVSELIDVSQLTT